MQHDSARPRHEVRVEGVVDVELRPASVPSFSAVVSLRGEHDLASAPDVAETIRSIHGNVLVDLTDCAFIDSTVIGALIRTSQVLEGEGHYLEIVAPPEDTPVARVLEIVSMHDLVVVHPVRPVHEAAGEGNS